LILVTFPAAKNHEWLSIIWYFRQTKY
jgi:hypothetical protein